LGKRAGIGPCNATSNLELSSSSSLFDFKDSTGLFTFFGVSLLTIFSLRKVVMDLTCSPCELEELLTSN